MVFVEVVLLPQVLLNPSDFCPRGGLLLLPPAALCLEFSHHTSKLVLHGPVQRPDALFLLQQLVPHQRVHRVVFSFGLHLFAHLLLGDDPLPQV